jgi:hypothetical protein
VGQLADEKFNLLRQDPRHPSLRLKNCGYLLYSLGPNGIDDQGRGFNDEPPGRDDISVRMPLPPRR